MPRALTTQEFIEHAVAKHGPSRYDYSKVEYKTQFIPVEISCTVCGRSFQQKPHTHMLGHGCTRCARSLTHEEFIARATKLHGMRYDYSLAVYESGRDNVRITCRECSTTFEVQAASHIRPSANGRGGCPTCRKTTALTTEQFIEKARAVHGGNMYDYGGLAYTTSHKHVQITCLRCKRVFSQTPNTHLNGSGCASCNRRLGPKERKWLDSLGVPVRQHTAHIDGLSFRVDGYNPSTNTVYEYLGDFWHGNPAVFSPEKVNPVCNVTFGYLYTKTLERIRLLESKYNVVYVWETPRA